MVILVTTTVLESSFGSTHHYPSLPIIHLYIIHPTTIYPPSIYLTHHPLPTHHPFTYPSSDHLSSTCSLSSIHPAIHPRPTHRLSTHHSPNYPPIINPHTFTQSPTHQSPVQHLFTGPPTINLPQAHRLDWVLVRSRWAQKKSHPSAGGRRGRSNRDAERRAKRVLKLLWQSGR